MTRFLKRKTHQRWLAVVLSEERADFIGIRREVGQRPQVLLAESIERRGDDTVTLNTLRKPLRLMDYRCTTVLSPGEYQLIQVPSIPGPVEETREMMRWKLKDQVEFPVESASIDLLPIPGFGKSKQMYAALASGVAVASRVQTFQSAKVPLTAIDLPELSQRNLAALFDEPGRGLATLIFDDDEGLLTFTQGGELLLARRIECSARQLLRADPEQRDALYERIALNVQRSLDGFDRSDAAVTLSRLMVAAIPGLDGFIAYLGENISLPVVAMNLATALDFGAMPGMLDPQRQFQSLRALGAALRVEAGGA